MPATTAPDVPVDGPGLPSRLAPLSLGMSWSAAQSALPALFEEGGLRLGDSGIRVEPLSDRQGLSLTGTLMQFESPVQLEQAIAKWGAPQYVLRAGHCARGWLGDDGVRAWVVEPRRSPTGRCPVPEALPDRTGNELLLEEYWSVAELLPRDSQRFGFESDDSLLGVRLDELRRALGPRLREGGANAPEAAFAELPPIHLAPTPTYVSFELSENRVRVLRVELPALSNDAELAPEALLRRLESRWGKLDPIEPHARLVSRGRPRVEVNVLGGPVSSITVRDVPDCPVETVTESEKAIRSLAARWIRKRRTRKPPAPAGKPATRYVDRGYRLGPAPAALVQEREHAPECRENYWVLRRSRPECQAELIESELWGQDCCNQRCAAEPQQWMMRLFNAVQGRDVKMFRRLMPDRGWIRVTSRPASRPQQARSFDLAADRVEAASFDRFPDWSPHGDGVACAALADGRTRCEAGPTSYRTRFTWSGTAMDMRLEEVLLETP